MIKALRWKFVRTAMLAFSLVIVITMGVINLVHFLISEQMINERMELLVANDGLLPDNKNTIVGWLGHSFYAKEHADDETLFEIRYYTVTLNEEGQAISADLKRSATEKRADAVEKAETLWRAKKTSGYIDCCKYQTVVSAGQTKYIFLNCHRSITERKTFLLISIILCAGGLLLVFGLLYLLSGQAIRPLLENYEKQKRFITDASHELKTPLAIISANAEVLEMVNGENEWTQSIGKQIRRMGNLIEKMVLLSRIEEEDIKLTMSRFDFAALVEEVAEPFQTLAETKGKGLRIEHRHAEHVTAEEQLFCADREAIRQMLSILFDNAVKYAKEDTVITCSVLTSSHPDLVIKNQTDGLTKGNQNRLFDRFYRADASRNSESGGSGIGLAIVKAIAEAHNGKASAFSKDGSEIQFHIQF